MSCRLHSAGRKSIPAGARPASEAPPAPAAAAAAVSGRAVLAGLRGLVVVAAAGSLSAANQGNSLSNTAGRNGTGGSGGPVAGGGSGSRWLLSVPARAVASPSVSVRPAVDEAWPRGSGGGGGGGVSAANRSPPNSGPDSGPEPASAPGLLLRIANFFLGRGSSGGGEEEEVYTPPVREGWSGLITQVNTAAERAYCTFLVARQFSFAAANAADAAFDAEDAADSAELAAEDASVRDYGAARAWSRRLLESQLPPAPQTALPSAPGPSGASAGPAARWPAKRRLVVGLNLSDLADAIVNVRGYLPELYESEEDAVLKDMDAELYGLWRRLMDEAKEAVHDPDDLARIAVLAEQTIFKLREVKGECVRRRRAEKEAKAANAAVGENGALSPPPPPPRRP